MCVANNSHTLTDEQSFYRGFAYVSMYVHFEDHEFCSLHLFNISEQQQFPIEKCQLVGFFSKINPLYL